MQLTGMMPIVFTPFDQNGLVDEQSLRHIVRFELEGGAHAIGVNGFASEAYTMTDKERQQTAAIVASEVDGAVPLIIGIASGSTEAAIEEIGFYAQFDPAAMMVLPPSTMHMEESAFVQHYVELGEFSPIPIIVQQAPHLPRYTHTLLSAESLAQINQQSQTVCYFKIEGKGAPERIAALAPLVDLEKVGLFGGGGGITLLPELRAGANGLIPGVGFNEYFIKAWAAWTDGDEDKAQSIIESIQPLVSAVSGPGHEFSLHARKYLMHRAGYINHVTVRRPTVPFLPEHAAKLDEIVSGLDLRIAK